MPAAELASNEELAKTQGRFESGNKNNQDQENIGETKETIESAKGPEETGELADKDIGQTVKEAEADIKERFGAIADHGGATPKDIAAAKEAGDNILALNNQDARGTEQEIGDLIQSDGRLSYEEAQEEAGKVQDRAVKRRVIESLHEDNAPFYDERKVDKYSIEARTENIKEDMAEELMEDHYIKAEEDIENSKGSLESKNEKAEMLKLELEYLNEKIDSIDDQLFEKKDMDIELSEYEKAMDRSRDKMVERLHSIKKELTIMEAKEKFKDFSAEIEQITTRGDGTLIKRETFWRDDIDFGASLEHLKIHHDGEVAGSQFNNELFKNPQEVEILIKELLPKTLKYDQHGRAELTLDISHNKEKLIGWTGVKSVEEVRQMFPDAKFEKKQRNSGGTEAVEDGIKGAWYPEMTRDPETNEFVVAKDAEGNIKNPKYKFEPDANIASVSREKFQEASKTDKLTVIIQKDGKTEKPVVLTVYPGECAPAFPAKINSELDIPNTIGDSKETKFWSEHAFIKAE